MSTTLADEVAEIGPAKYLPNPKPQRKGKALCLSGGGYRAALFHLGALRRLNEVGILAALDTIVSVSGGSILAAHLATRVPAWPTQGPIPEWDRDVAGPFRAFVRHNIRTRPVILRLLPWNWLRPGTQAVALEEQYHKYLTGLTLDQLPCRPRFVFCATDMAFGVNWVFQRERAGDYQAGYLDASAVADWPVARAVAASSCFPPVFDPLPMHLAPGDLHDGACPAGAERDGCIRNLALSDGGVYDNMGLEPVWKDHELVLVSDGGAPFRASSDTGALGQVLRYTDIVGNQAAATRKRWLIANLQNGVMEGAYWGIGSDVAAYPCRPVEGFPEDLVKRVISCVRTDLDAFSDAEAYILENHGYTLAAAAIESHAKGLLSAGFSPAKTPYDQYMKEARVRRDLDGSDRRSWLGRGWRMWD